MHLFSLSLILIIMVGCASSPTKEILRKNLPGRWESKKGTMIVGCSGAFNLDYENDDNLLNYSTRTKGSYISSVTQNGFKVKPVTTFYLVEAWPHKDDVGIVMMVDGHEWTKVVPYRCNGN